MLMNRFLSPFSSLGWAFSGPYYKVFASPNGRAHTGNAAIKRASRKRRNKRK